MKYPFACLGGFAACLASTAALAASVSGVSGPTFVDSTSPFLRYGPTNAVTLAYSPRYADRAAEATAYVVIRRVDAVNGITNVVATCPAGDGLCDLSVAAADDHRFRLLMTAYDASDAVIGPTLVSDLVLPYAYAKGGAQVTVDTRANSLQEIADAGGTALLAYDTAWATNGVPASVKISCEHICRTTKGRFFSVTTNDLFSADAPAVGGFARKIDPNEGGLFVFHCSFLDALGNPVNDDLTASYAFPFKPGLIFSIR